MEHRARELLVSPDPLLLTPVILGKSLSEFRSFSVNLEMVTSYSITDPVAQRNREAESNSVEGVGFGVKPCCTTSSL